MNKKVSVVLCSYNGEKFIGEQIDSIIQQTYKNFEIIICDDCSTDKTVEIVNHYQQKYGFIKVINNRTRLGVIKNFEKGIEIAKGDYIALCDQDDIWYPEKLETEIEYIKNLKKPALVHSDLEVINENGQTIYKSFFKWKGYSFPKEKALSVLISRSGVMGNTIVFNKYLKQKILPFPNNIPMHDYYIGVINELYGKRITVNDTLVKYRLHGKNIGNKKRRLISRLLGFFNEPLPYNDRIEFLELLLEQKDIHDEDKKEIIKFLNCIKQYCYNKQYYKKGYKYMFKFYLRRFIHKVVKID